ncbi:MAG: lysophospholipid acyltransferase family protein [bacterium]
MLRSVKYFLARVFNSLLYRLVRGYIGTFRLTIENEDRWMRYLEEGGTVLLCIWHQQFLSIIRHFKNYTSSYRPALMISRSRDGDVIAEIARKSGWWPVRGSSSRGGGEALREMVERLQDGRLALHIVDGPRGPAGKVKPGVVRMAHAAGAAVVPVYVSADRAWYLKSWDRFLVPKPFSRVALRFGEIIRLEPAATAEDFERQRVQVESAMLPWLVC